MVDLPLAGRSFSSSSVEVAGQAMAGLFLSSVLHLYLYDPSLGQLLQIIHPHFGLGSYPGLEASLEMGFENDPILFHLLEVFGLEMMVV